MRFEYKTIRFADRNAQRQLDTDMLEQGLNKLGEQGWELVSVSVVGASTPIAAYAIFKRPRN